MVKLEQPDGKDWDKLRCGYDKSILENKYNAIRNDLEKVLLKNGVDKDTGIPLDIISRQMMGGLLYVNDQSYWMAVSEYRTNQREKYGDAYKNKKS